jgi:hypothetical protein
VLYFAPKRDRIFVLATFELEKRYLATYLECRSIIERYQLHAFPLDVLPDATRIEYIELGNKYRSERDSINRLQPRMAQIAERYGGPDVTSYFLDTTTMPDYSRNRSSVFTGEDNNVWKDGTAQLIGHIQLAEDEDFKKLRNPLNWIYLPLRTVLRVPMHLLQLSGTTFGKFWDKLAELMAGLLVLAMILFILFWFFGVPSDTL